MLVSMYNIHLNIDCLIVTCYHYFNLLILAFVLTIPELYKKSHKCFVTALTVMV